jgi:hypothetical protein
MGSQGEEEEDWGGAARVRRPCRFFRRHCRLPGPSLSRRTTSSQALPPTDPSKIPPFDLLPSKEEHRARYSLASSSSPFNAAAWYDLGRGGYASAVQRGESWYAQATRKKQVASLTRWGGGVVVAAGRVCGSVEEEAKAAEQPMSSPGFDYELLRC